MQLDLATSEGATVEMATTSGVVFFLYAQEASFCVMVELARHDDVPDVFAMGCNRLAGDSQATALRSLSSPHRNTHTTSHNTNQLVYDWIKFTNTHETRSVILKGTENKIRRGHPH